MASIKIKATPQAVMFFKNKMTGGKIYLDGINICKLGKLFSRQNVLFDKTLYETTISPGIHNVSVDRGIIGGSAKETFSIQENEKLTALIHITAFLKRLTVKIC